MGTARTLCRTVGSAAGRHAPVSTASRLAVSGRGMRCSGCGDGTLEGKGSNRFSIQQCIMGAGLAWRASSDVLDGFGHAASLRRRALSHHACEECRHSATDTQRECAKPLPSRRCPTDRADAEFRLRGEVALVTPTPSLSLPNEAPAESAGLRCFRQMSALGRKLTLGV